MVSLEENPYRNNFWEDDGFRTTEIFPEKGKQKIEDSYGSEEMEWEYTIPDVEELEYDKFDDPAIHREHVMNKGTQDYFDVDFSKYPGLYNFLHVADNLIAIKRLNEEMRQEAYYSAKLAVDYYNELEKANLEFVELVKFNSMLVGGEMYYLTFEAKDGDGLVSVYQAKVWWPIRKNKKIGEVIMCRKKPSTYQPSKGAEKNHGCGKGCGCVDCTT